MTSLLSPPKVVLLAAHFAIKSDVDSLTILALRYDKVLQKELLLRILLTCLPETTEPARYVELLQRLESDEFEKDDASREIDASSVEHFTDVEVAKKVRKLRLLPLTSSVAPRHATEDLLSQFLLARAHRIDEEAGLLTQIPDLIVPFLDHAPCIRTWMISALLPLLRRNYEYYPHSPIQHTLSEFEQLNDRAAVALLLEQTGVSDDSLSHIGRDLRGLIGPWLYNDARWKYDDTLIGEDGQPVSQNKTCPGWEQMLEWLTEQASRSWIVAVKAIEQWDGPNDVDLSGYGSMWMEDEDQGYLESRYARAALAAAYLVTEASVEALVGVNTIITRVNALLGEDPMPTLQVASSLLPPLNELNNESIIVAKNATHMRNDLLEESNILTAPTKQSTHILHALTLSAFILTKAGAPCCIRRAGELAFLQDQREQKSEALKFINTLRNNTAKTDDKYWVRARNELLWLRDWGAEETASDASTRLQGVFGRLDRAFLEIECLKAFLASGRYSLARSIYEDSHEKILSEKVLEDTIVAAAMNAYDNASNPNRTRGGLLKCDDIVHAFPKTLPTDGAAAKKIEALLRATHGLSSYRLALKQGEPFTPVVLRVHSDPVSIVGKVLQQNPHSYTRLQAFLEIGSNMVEAGLPVQKKSNRPLAVLDELEQHALVEKRVTSMCIDAALTEDDFETAYSYVVNRLASGRTVLTSADEYSWRAALEAGKYRRTARTIRPTHIGTSSGNLDVRHLEQRIECLSTALRIAPTDTLQEILKVFRKCEEELGAAVKADEEQESAWDDQGDVQAMPGGFSSEVPAGVVRSNTTRSAKQQEEAPMSLFDLSRATMARAQFNLPALSSLQRGEQQAKQSTPEEHDDQNRVRKRDQLREAAVGTLASGVGWLIGAQPARPQSRASE
ncbi:Sec39 domain-containing protein [Truncatella angustata]|uniref:Sec39 domain-containing protein n=1 Tax=Truncatella angustata TaxID=152316 RepID=A0A9P8UNH1_9PEZI|nr:Sec39 domain-containing protein [Truncatella angustata]KAH6655333.1 Sec39 domain-containing protein [Truncatella angustata]